MTKLNGVALAGLSAAGFHVFTENIIYYSRAIMYSTSQINTGDAESAIHELVWLRGFWTAFGHPLFTMMTGLGLMVALRTHSKVVRVLAPLIGYLMAALLHMMFNSQATFAQGMMRYIIWSLRGGVAVGGLGDDLRGVRQLFTEEPQDPCPAHRLRPDGVAEPGRPRRRSRACGTGPGRCWWRPPGAGRCCGPP